MIQINGKTYYGDNVTIKDGVITIDGKEQLGRAPIVTLNIIGNIKSLNIDYAQKINIEGNVTNVRNGSGDLTCGDVLNSLQSGSGDIKTNSIIGAVTTGSGDVTAVEIRGNIKTSSGDVNCKNSYGNIVL